MVNDAINHHDDDEPSADLPQQLLAAGNAAFDAGDYLRALELYHRACVIDSRDPRIWTALGLTFSNLDFPRESWRSYVLALNFDPINLDALWSASEFLLQMGDPQLANGLLKRYCELESDGERLALAADLAVEIEQDAREQGIPLRPDAAQGLQKDQTGSAEAYLEKDGADAGEPEAPTSLEDLMLSDEELEHAALASGGFSAQLALRLDGFDSSCSHCGLHIPTDAPFCWSCKAIHFYE